MCHWIRQSHVWRFRTTLFCIRRQTHVFAQHLTAIHLKQNHPKPLPSPTRPAKPGRSQDHRRNSLSPHVLRHQRTQLGHDSGSCPVCAQYQPGLALFDPTLSPFSTRFCPHFRAGLRTAPGGNTMAVNSRRATPGGPDTMPGATQAVPRVREPATSRAAVVSFNTGR